MQSILSFTFINTIYYCDVNQNIILNPILISNIVCGINCGPKSRKKPFIKKLKLEETKHHLCEILMTQIFYDIRLKVLMRVL